MLFDVSQMAKGDTCWISSDVAEGVLRNLFNGEPNWNLEHWKGTCKNYCVPPMWHDPLDRRDLNQQIAASTTLVGEIEPKDRRSLPADLKNSGFNTRITDLDQFLVATLVSWLELRRRTIEALEAVEHRRVAKERMELEARREALRVAQDRPFEREEVRYLKLGVKRHGVGEWESILRDQRLVFVHRTANRLSHEWAVVAHRRHRREQRRWDWRRWPWNPEWEWGALKVGPDNPPRYGGGGGREQEEIEEEETPYREDWDVWDDMDITDDEGDGDVLVQSSADDTATDSDLDVSDDEEEGQGGPANPAGGTLLGLISGAVVDAVGQPAVAGSASAVALVGPDDHTANNNNNNNPILERNAVHTISAPVLSRGASAASSSSSSSSPFGGNDPAATHHTSDSFRHKGYGLSPDQKRHIKSQPVLPELPSSVAGKRVMRRSSTELQLGHYNFGDHTAEALSRRLGVNGRAVESVDRNLLPLKEDMQQLQAKSFPGAAAIDTLVFRDCGLTGSGFAKLARNLRGNNFITSLDLRRNKIGDAGIKALARVLADSSCALKVLDLDSTGLRDNHLFMLAQAVERRMLRFKRSKGVGGPPAMVQGQDDGEDAPASAEQQTWAKKKKKKNGEEDEECEEYPCGLVEVHFGHNQITDASCQALAVLVDHLPKLRHLDLSWNRLKAMSAIALAERVGMQARTCTLEVLNLQFNSIGNPGAACLMDLVSGMDPFPSRPPKLKVLDLSFNGIFVGGVMDKVMNVVSRAPHVRSLQLNGNEIHSDDVDAIREALKETSLNLTKQEMVVGLASSAVADPLAVITD